MLFLILSMLDDEQRSLVEKIYRENHQFFLTIAMQITGSKANAEEAVSDALIKISLNIKRISNLTCPEIKPFCVTIVKNCSYDLMRKNKRIIMDGDDILYREEPSGITPEHEVIGQETRQTLSMMLKSLSEEDKEFLEMRFTYEMKFADIAQRLSISEEAAKKRGQRILNKLKQQYEENADEYYF